uniref:Uncharacterized protein n=1 Tax=Cannabis sativa TaxID=3483 RepID=A0A803QDE2_CANSA
MRRRYQNGKNMRRSLSDLEIEEVQGFKDLGFTFDKLKNPSVVNIIPGLQEKNEEDNMGLENKVRRPYLSEAWLAQSYSPPPPPPPPSWAFRKSSGEDMKAHIKFWARAVASNLRFSPLPTNPLLSKSPPVFYSPVPLLSSSSARSAAEPAALKHLSDGVKKSVKEEALESLKAMRSASVTEAKSPPSPVQALLGGISAGVIALILYKFTTTIEAALNRQTLSDNFSVQQITITIRTIINGLCYLATFVFGINSVGLVLYAGQLAINSFMEEESRNNETENKGENRSSSLSSTAETPTNTGDSNEGSQTSDDSQ